MKMKNRATIRKICFWVFNRSSAYPLYGTARNGLSAAPRVILPVFTLIEPSPFVVTSMVSIGRGAGPKTRTPAREYVEPWHGQRNQPRTPGKFTVAPLNDGFQGTLQPRCGHFQ